MSLPRVAIVTGGAQGIGRGITAKLLAAVDAQGAPKWSVVAVDRDAAGIADAERHFAEPVTAKRLLLLQGDCGDKAVAETTVAAAVSAFSRLDLLVNNAGGGGLNVPLLDVTPEQWRASLDGNLSSCFFFTQVAAPHLAAASGAIVNMASTRAAMSEPGCEGYAAAKGGVVALTHSTAASLRHKVTVNCVCPGWIDVSGAEWGAGRTQYEITADDAGQHWSGRVGCPGDVADAVMYLADAKFVTGQTLTIDGGMSKKMIYTE
jgi:NAD(P)-dependent dehydrogenase (short-subunit alcohol dehydrogenase family)